MDEAIFTDSDLIVAARSIAGAYASGAPMARVLCSASRGSTGLSKSLRELARTALLNGAVPDSFLSRAGRNAQELGWILKMGMEAGADVGNALDVLTERLERDERMANKLRAKTGGASLLTRMGMAFFFPLFSGVSATILGNNDLFGSAASGTPRSFLLLAGAYVSVMLYLSDSLSHPEKGTLGHLRSAAPYALVAFAVLFASYAYLPDAI